MATASESEEIVECMFCRQPFPQRYFHTHLEMCSQHDHTWKDKDDESDPTKTTDTTNNDPDAINIVVKTLNGKSYDIHGLHSYDTILNIKNKVKDEGGVLPINQRLMFNNKQLEDDKTLKDYNLKQGQSLYLIVFNYIQNDLLNESKQEIEVKLKSEHQLFLRMVNGKSITLNNITMIDSIANIKKKINIQEKIPIFKQVLVFTGQTLNDKKTLEDYNIKPGSIIHFIVKFDDTPQMYIIHILSAYFVCNELNNYK